jgi:hypothetical protein
MKTAATILIGLAAITMVVAIRNVFGDGPDKPDQAANSARFVGYVVGSFMVPIVLLIAGLIVWNKSNLR